MILRNEWSLRLQSDISVCELCLIFSHASAPVQLGKSSFVLGHWNPTDHHRSTSLFYEEEGWGTLGWRKTGILLTPNTTQPILLYTPTKVLTLLRYRVLIFPFFVALIGIGPSPDYVLLNSNGSPVFLFTLSSTLSIEHKLWNHRYITLSSLSHVTMASHIHIKIHLRHTPFNKATALLNPPQIVSLTGGQVFKDKSLWGPFSCKPPCTGA